MVEGMVMRVFIDWVILFDFKVMVLCYVGECVVRGEVESNFCYLEISVNISFCVLKLQGSVLYDVWW